MLKAGETAPDFELPDQDGRPRRLSTLLADGPVVLFWYPGASTSGCTAEACHFRDLGAEFASAGAQRIGISMDDVRAQKSFSDDNSFDYPLLADSDGTVATMYGVRRKWLKAAPVKRATFVIAADRTVVESFTSERSMEVHADKALEAVRAGSAAG